MMSASQAILRVVGGGDGPGERARPGRGAWQPVSGEPGVTAAAREPAVSSGGGVAGSVGCGGVEAVKEVPVADGDHDLGPEAAGGGQGSGGEGGFAGADEAVEELLGPGAALQVRVRSGGFGRRAEAGPGVGCRRRLRLRTFVRVRGGGLGAGVGGGVHDGQEVFVLVGGGEDFEVVESAAGAALEGALAVAEVFFAGFGAVLVDGVGQAVGDAGEEVVVVLGRGAGQDVFHPGEICRVGDVPDAVQRGGDGGSGAGGDGPGGEGGGGFLAGRGEELTGDAGTGQDGGGEGEAAAGFSRTDPQPGPQELGGVPGSVIGRRHGSGRSGGRLGGGAGGSSNGSGRVSAAFGAVVRVVAPAGGPAGGLARGSGGVDRRGAGPVHGRRGEQLQVLAPSGDFFCQPGEIRGGREPGHGQLTGRGLHGGLQQHQATLQAVHRPEGEDIRGGSTQTGGTQAGGSPAVVPAVPRGLGYDAQAASNGGTQSKSARIGDAPQPGTTRTGHCRPVRVTACAFPNGFHRETLSEGSDNLGARRSGTPARRIAPGKWAEIRRSAGTRRSAGLG